MKPSNVWHGHSTRPSLPAGTARKASGSLLHGRRNRFIMQTTKNRKFPPVGNSLLYISLLSVALIASFTSSAILNNLFAICNSRLLPTNQIVNCDGRVRPQGRTLVLVCILSSNPWFRLYSLKHSQEWYAASSCLKAADISDFSKRLDIPGQFCIIINVNYFR